MQPPDSWRVLVSVVLNEPKIVRKDTMSQKTKFTTKRQSLEHVESEAVGLAALTICEAMMMALVEKGVLMDDERLAILEDCSDALSHSASDAESTSLHRSAAKIVEFVTANSNSIKATQKIG